MIWLRVLLASAALMASPISPLPTSVELCNGFIEQNDLAIPVSAQIEGGGITEEQFHQALDRIYEVYAPIIAALGKELSINRDWASSIVNASAQQIGNTYKLNMYGGMARHPAINVDGFMTVACHEVGHHLGGAPRYGSARGISWASNEGQSDYFATLSCLRKVWTHEDNLNWQTTATIPDNVRQSCDGVFATPEEQLQCYRGAAAAVTLGTLMQTLRRETVVPAIETPDPNIVARMKDAHPASQCRLDTYYQGALCSPAIAGEDLSPTDPIPGTCTLARSYSHGLRPLCWYKPGEQNRAPEVAPEIVW